MLTHDREALRARGWATVKLDIEDLPMAARSVVAAVEALGNLDVVRSKMSVIEPTFDGYQTTTRSGMSLHSDNTYAANPCDVMALFCFARSESGGESRVVDALDVVRETLDERERSLLQQPEWVWNEAGCRPTAPRPVMGTDGSIRWWRDMLLPQATHQTELADRLEANLDAFAVTTSLEPGEALILLNKRALHGRTSFVGWRKMLRFHLWASSSIANNMV